MEQAIHMCEAKDKLIAKQNDELADAHERARELEERLRAVADHVATGMAALEPLATSET